MKSKVRTVERRKDPLSQERVVAAAIAILDTEGETALTFRALAARLATGSGAIYWHVPDKSALLALATDDVIIAAMAHVTSIHAPAAAIQAFGLVLFDRIDAHPWIGSQLVQEPWQPAALRVFEFIGAQLQALNVAEEDLFETWSALIHYIFGAAGMNAANARRPHNGMDRATYLAKAAARWSELDPVTHPFLRRLAARLPQHDDRAQFVAGLNLILAGIGAPEKHSDSLNA